MSINQITRISIKNYRSIVDLTVDLPALTVLVGENGSGKSNFIDAIRFVGSALQFGLNSARYNRYTSGGGGVFNSNDTVFEIYMRVDKIDRYYTFAFHRSGVNKLKYESYRSGDEIIFERTESEWKIIPSGLNPSLGHDLFFPLLAGQPEMAPVYQFLTNMSFYNIFPDKMREIGSPAAQPYPLADSGENLFSVLDEFLKQSAWAKNFLYSLRNVLPYIESVETVSTGGFVITSFNYSKGELLPHLPQPEESDGTLRILATLLALYQDPPRALLALEEPELFVHPGALFALFEVIQEASLRSQVIITTHSPDLISYCNVNDLRVVERTENGTQIGVIDDKQRHAIEQKLFKASDLLRIDGQLHRAAADEE